MKNLLQLIFLAVFVFFYRFIIRFRPDICAVPKSAAETNGHGNGNADDFADSDSKTIAESGTDEYADGYEDADEYAVAHPDTDHAGPRRSE